MSTPSRELDWLKQDIDEIKEKLDVLQEERQQRIGARDRTILLIKWVGAITSSISISSLLAVVALWRQMTGQH